MKNVYHGVVMTDEEGRVAVELREWFEALNKDFRCQLTVIGRFAQAMVEEEIHNNRFVICTNMANVKVFWQVSGIRKDPFAEAHRIPVEEEKPAEEQGTFACKGVGTAPGAGAKLQRRQEDARRFANVGKAHHDKRQGTAPTVGRAHVRDTQPPRGGGFF